MADVDRLREPLPPDFEFDERERALIEIAAAQAADIDRLEVDIGERGIRVGDRLNPSVPEVRQSRVALARILGQVDLPEVGTTARPTAAGSRRRADGGTSRADGRRLGPSRSGAGFSLPGARAELSPTRCGRQAPSRRGAGGASRR